MANALILVSSKADSRNALALLGACRPLALENVIVAVCEASVRDFAQAELDTLATAQTNVILSPFEPRGEACAALLASEWIDDDSELLVASACDGAIDLAAMTAHFRGSQWEAGLATRRHANGGGAQDAPDAQNAPDDNYVRLDPRGHVMEITTRKPAGAQTAAGAYWFAHGRDFLRAARAMIRKNPNQPGLYDVCPALNELVLENRAIGVYPLKDG